MYGQLNLFSFRPEVKIFHPTPKKLNEDLWKIVRKTDDRVYSFGSFNYFQDKEENHTCLTVVIYKVNHARLCKSVSREPIGFCTLSYISPDHINPVIDVWVMPYYRDMGFGSILVNRANQESVRLTGQMPRGSDKNHDSCWDARFRRDQESEREYQKRALYWRDTTPGGGQQLLSFSSLEPSSRSITRLIGKMSVSRELDSDMIRSILRKYEGYR